MESIAEKARLRREQQTDLPIAAQPVRELSRIDRHLHKAMRELARLDPELPAEFTFTWCGATFRARAERHPKGMRLSLQGDLGIVPYSAEDRSARDRLFALVDGRHSDRKFSIGGRQRLRFFSETEVGPPPTAKQMMIWTAQLLLRARPFLDLARESCLRNEKGARFGTPNPRPAVCRLEPG